MRSVAFHIPLLFLLRFVEVGNSVANLLTTVNPVVLPFKVPETQLVQGVRVSLLFVANKSNTVSYESICGS